MVSSSEESNSTIAQVVIPARCMATVDVGKLAYNSMPVIMGESVQVLLLDGGTDRWDAVTGILLSPQ